MFEVSALTGENINESFATLAKYGLITF